MDEYHEEFLHRLKKSQHAVKVVAEWMKQYGKVKVPPINVRPKYTNPDDYRDSGDILFKRPDGWKRYEVKGRSIKFTEKEDFPFHTLIICAVQSFDKTVEEGKQPVAYITLSKDKKCVAIVNVENTREYWSTQTVLEPVRGYHYDVYVCPLEHVDFYRLENRDE